MRLQPEELGKTVIALATQNDTLTYRIPVGMNWVVPQLRTPTGTWTASAVVTAEVSEDGSQFSDIPAGAVTYTSAGVKAIQSVTGVKYYRLRVSTPQSGSDTVFPLVEVTRDNNG